ncbi:MAG: hypothetical protein H7Y19_14585 [Luteimonas sp.]|nr:hypothetical protein [Luteimonas sp.]
MIKQGISCFCDIPFEQLDIHTRKYGTFGVGISRKVLSECGARPVAYVPMPSSRPDVRGHSLAADLRALIRGIQEHIHPPGPWSEESSRAVGAELLSEKAVIDELESVFNRELLAFLKFFDSDLPANDPENYYMEREWRKFMPMPLQLSLQHVVVPQAYASRTLERYPQHREKLKTLERLEN